MVKQKVSWNKQLIMSSHCSFVERWAALTYNTALYDHSKAIRIPLSPKVLLHQFSVNIDLRMLRASVGSFWSHFTLLILLCWLQFATCKQKWLAKHDDKFCDHCFISASLTTSKFLSHCEFYFDVDFSTW